MTIVGNIVGWSGAPYTQAPDPAAVIVGTNPLLNVSDGNYVEMAVGVRVFTNVPAPAGVDGDRIATSGVYGRLLIAGGTADVTVALWNGTTQLGTKSYPGLSAALSLAYLIGSENTDYSQLAMGPALAAGTLRFSVTVTAVSVPGTTTARWDQAELQTQWSEVALAPSNDNFVSAIALTSLAVGAPDVDNTEGSNQVGEPSVSGYLPYGTLWYSWVGGTGPATLSMTGLGQGAAGVYTGTTLAGLTQVASGFAGDVLSWSATEGTTYWIQVGSYGWSGAGPIGFTGSGSAQTPPPEPDAAAVEDAVWVIGEDGTDVPPDTVVAADLSGIGILRRISETYAAPTLDAETGRPVGWGPTSTLDVEFGTIAITIGGIDVTKVRGAKTDLSALQLQEPYGEGPAQIRVTGATIWDVGTTGYAWLAEEVNADVYHRNPDGTYCCTLWSGIIEGIRPDFDGIDLDLMGAFAGPAGLFPHRPKLTELERDIGSSLVYAIRRASQGASRRKSFALATVGITTRDRGSRHESLLDYCSRLLGMAQTAAGAQWTIGRVVGIRRKYELRLKNLTTVDITLHVGARGVKVDLRRDLSQVTRFVMGEGVNKDGGRWRGVKLPNVGKETVPTYPGTALTIGSTGASVQVWQAEVMSDGHSTGDFDGVVNGVFGELEATAARDIQRAAGLAVTGIVDSATWSATWSNGATDLNLGGAAFFPIAADTRVTPWLYSSNGSVTAVNPGADRSVLPLGRFVSYGQNISKKEATRNATSILAREANASWHGSVSIDGVDPVEMSRLHIREGMNLRLRGLGGWAGKVLHVAGVTWSRSGPSWSVSLSVDEGARDLLTLAELRARDREARQDPVRLAISQLRRSTQPRDTPGVWDSEGGYGVLPERDCPGGQWSVFVIAGGQYGALSRVLLRTAPATKFAVALFGKKVTPSVLASLVPQPLVAYTDTTHMPWDKPSIQDDLRRYLFIESWGAYKNAAGYSPGYETHPTTGKATGMPVTGVLDVNSNTNYGLDLEPRLYVAVWALGTTKIRGQVRLLPNE